MASLARKLWTVDEYEQMIEKGILTEDDRVELIKGEIVEMAAIGPRHAMCVMRLDELFHELLRRTVLISVQNPIRLPDYSEPEPDLALLKRRSDEYSHEHPKADDILLLVEVSDSTLATDRRVKVPLYAEAGIAEVWLVNLDKDVVEVYSEPTGGKYEKMALARRGEALVLPGGLPGQISVAEVLG